MVGAARTTAAALAPPLTGMRTYTIGETTLADHDRLIAERPPVLRA